MLKLMSGTLSATNAAFYACRPIRRTVRLQLLRRLREHLRERRLNLEEPVAKMLQGCTQRRVGGRTEGAARNDFFPTHLSSIAPFELARCANSGGAAPCSCASSPHTTTSEHHQVHLLRPSLVLLCDGFFLFLQHRFCTTPGSAGHYPIRHLLHDHGASHLQPPIKHESRAQSYAEAHCGTVEDLHALQPPHLIHNVRHRMHCTCTSRSMRVDRC